ncbi:MAG TPA: hypothetical protein VLA04_01625 [Verrucomicrobiae bacterium]|nr:hypothetical protein [Verrucomicrobiae bacterium]
MSDITQTPVDELTEEEAVAELDALEQTLPALETFISEATDAHDKHVANVEAATTQLNAELSAIEGQASAFEHEMQQQIMNGSALEKDEPAPAAPVAQAPAPMPAPAPAPVSTPPAHQWTPPVQQVPVAAPAPAMPYMPAAQAAPAPAYAPAPAPYNQSPTNTPGY